MLELMSWRFVWDNKMLDGFSGEKELGRKVVVGKKLVV